MCNTLLALLLACTGHPAPAHPFRPLTEIHVAPRAAADLYTIDPESSTYAERIFKTSPGRHVLIGRSIVIDCTGQPNVPGNVCYRAPN